MGPVRFALLALLLLTVCSSRAQEKELFYWEAGRKLKWEDFRGRPFKTAWAAATTASGISYEFSSEEKGDRKKIHFRVAAYFDPIQSWYQPTLCNDLILSHEQLHFDISELYARKMREALAKTVFTAGIKAEVRAIHKTILRELNAFQARYDKETNYSRNTEQQLIWNRKIQEALESGIVLNP